MRLRRADWRFLLPHPDGGCFDHLVVIGGPADLGSLLVGAGAAKRVSRELPEGPSANAVALLADSPVDVNSAIRCLAPGGVLYWEVDRRRHPARTSGSVHRALAEAGLQQTSHYWVIPGFAEARRYLPLDQPATVKWFFTTRFLASTPLRLLLERVVTFAADRAPHALANLIPCRAVVAVAPPHTWPPTATPLVAPTASRASGQTHQVLFTSGQDDGSRIVLLLFPAHGEAPETVLKLARIPSFEGHTRREQDSLRRLRAQLPPSMQGTLPEPLGTYVAGRTAVFVERPIAGRMLAASTGRWHAPVREQVADLEAAANWLVRFHLATISERRAWGDGIMTRWFEPTLARYENGVDVSPGDRALIARLRDHAQTLAAESFPVVWTHNDFNPWHVYREASSTRVIDWEFGPEDLAQRQGLALGDLLYFVTHWLALARGSHTQSRQASDFADLFLRGPAREQRCRAAQEAIVGYMEHLRITPAFLPLILAHTWMERAVDRQHRLNMLAAPEQPTSGENQFRGKVHLLARASDRLFAPAEALGSRRVVPSPTPSPSPESRRP